MSTNSMKPGSSGRVGVSGKSIGLVVAAVVLVMLVLVMLVIAAFFNSLGNGPSGPFPGAGI